MIGDNKKLYFLVFLTLLFVFFVSSANAGSAQVVNVTTAPQITSSGVNVGTITKGFSKAANSDVYRPVVQVISRARFASVAKFAIRRSPYGLAFLLAYGYYNTETGELKKKPTSLEELAYHDSFLKNVVGSIGSSNGGQVSVLSGTLSDLFANYSFRPVEGRSEYTNVVKSYGRITQVTIHYCEGGPCSGYPNPVVYITYDKNANTDIPKLEDFSLSVSDDDFLTSLSEYTSQNPYGGSSLFLNSDGSVNQDYFADGVDIEVYTPTEKENMGKFGSGILQSNDPSADHYVTPQEYSDIEAEYNALNMTPEELAEFLGTQGKGALTNDSMLSILDKAFAKNRAENKKDKETATDFDGLTREQYAQEQALKETREQTKNDLEKQEIDNLVGESTPKKDDLNSQWDEMDLKLINPTALPEISFNLPSQISYGGCQSVSTNILGNDFTFPSSSGCQKIEKAKEVFGWFLYMVFAWSIFVSLTKES